MAIVHGHINISNAMQYYTGYKLPNELDVFKHTEGLERRYEKVYERSIKLFKEFDNTFTIVVKNQDQKKQFVNGASCTLQISDQNGDLIVEKIGTVLDDGSSVATKGHISFTITESDMLKLDQIFYHGVLRFTDTDSTVKVLYADTRYNAAIQFEVVGDTSPEFTASQLITEFSLIDDEFVSSSVDAQPNRNSNSALHTAVYYLTNFSGTIKIYGTMEDGASYATDSQQSDFYLINKTDFSEHTGRKYVNFTGIHKRVAFVAHHSDSSSAPDSSTVLSGLDKILYRS
jgi:hypothetical protein|tara:strand:- start:421 stop:1281 length:861 start_codon:yes stop_codon:yes gene_type:complete